MAGKNMLFQERTKAVTASFGEQPDQAVTMANVHALTLYQLRQELTRRGIFDDVFGSEGEKRQISHTACLQVMVGELVKEEEAAQAQRTVELEARLAGEQPAAGEDAAGAQGESLQERLARQKAERKQQALERSAKRQANKQYFEAKKEANASSAPTTTAGTPAAAADGAEEGDAEETKFS